EGSTYGQDLSFRPPSPSGPRPLYASPEASLSISSLEGDEHRAVPDTDGAVSPDFIVTMLNSGVLIQSRSGDSIQTNTLAEFWGVTNAGFAVVYDPRVLWDPYWNR